MGDQPRAICGHLERGGHQGTEICEATPNHPGDHVMVSFDRWVSEEVAWHRKLNRPIPHWLWTIAEEARRFGAAQLAEALAEDRDRRRRPSGEGVVPGTRVDRPEWRQVAETGGEWRAPDDGGRSIAPSTPGKIPPGVQIVHAGSIGPRTRGEGMASVEEVKAAALAIKEQVDIARGLMEQANNIMGQQNTEAARLLATSSRDEPAAIHHRIRSTEMSLDDALSNSAIVIDQIDQFCASV